MSNTFIYAPKVGWTDDSLGTEKVMPDYSRAWRNGSVTPGYTQIGDTEFIIPPQAISVMTIPKNKAVNVLRSKGSIQTKTGYSEAIIDISLFFHNRESINGYPVSSSVVYSGNKRIDDLFKDLLVEETNEPTWYINGLRPLLAQFKRTPFLPIYNPELNDIYEINAVALKEITVETVNGFPDCLVANLRLLKFDPSVYLSYTTDFYNAFNWPLFRWHYQQVFSEANASNKDKTYLKAVTGEKFNTLSFEIVNEHDLSNIVYQKQAFRKKVTPAEKVAAAKGSKAESSKILHDGEQIQAGYNQMARYKKNPKKWLNQGETQVYYPKDFEDRDSDPFYEEGQPLKDYFRFELQTEKYYKEAREKRYAESGHNVIIPCSDITFINEISNAYNAANIILATYEKDYNDAKDQLTMDESQLKFDQIELEDLIVEHVSISLANILSQVQIQQMETPAYQYMGSGDTNISLTISTNNQNSVKGLVSLVKDAERHVRNYKTGIVNGFLGLKNELLQLFGVQYVLVQGMNIQTVENYPGWFSIQLQLTGFNRNQRDSEKLKVINANFDNEAQMRLAKATTQPIVENELLKFEVYPDLELPTHKELEAFCTAAGIDNPYPADPVCPYTEMKVLKGRFVDPDFYINTPVTMRNQLKEQIDAIKTKSNNGEAFMVMKDLYTGEGTDDGAKIKIPGVKERMAVDGSGEIYPFEMNDGTYKSYAEIENDVKRILLEEKSTSDSESTSSGVDEEASAFVSSLTSVQPLSSEGTVGFASTTAGAVASLEQQRYSDRVTSVDPKDRFITHSKTATVNTTYGWQYDVATVFNVYHIPSYVWIPIMMEESTGNVGSHNYNPGTGDDSYGLFQINMIASLKRDGTYNRRQLLTPIYNATVAARDFMLAAYKVAITKYKKPEDITIYVWKNGIRCGWPKGQDGVTRDITFKERVRAFVGDSMYYTKIAGGKPIDASMFLSAGNKMPKDIYSANDVFNSEITLNEAYEEVENKYEEVEAHSFDAGAVDLQKLWEDSFIDTLETDHRGRLLRAFPTFQMLLIDEGKWISWVKMWDNFYGFNAIKSIDVVNSRKMAATTCIIKMTNVYSNLTSVDLGSSSANDARGVNYTANYEWHDILFNAFDHQSLIEARKEKLNSLMLQTGARLHLRMGYGSNAAELPIVFNGTITELTANDDIVEILGQGDGMELCNPIAATRDGTDNGNETVEPRTGLAHLICRRENVLQQIITQFMDNPYRESDLADILLRRPTNPNAVVHFGNPVYCPENIEIELPGKDIAITEADMNIYTAAGTGSRSQWSYQEDDFLVKYGSKMEGEGMGKSKVFKWGLIPWPGGEEPNIPISFYNKTIWDVANTFATIIPDYITAIAPFEMRSTLFYGKPYWPYFYRYIYKYEWHEDKELFEKSSAIKKPLSKPFSQCHVYNGYTDIVANKIKATEDGMATNVIATFQNGLTSKTMCADIDIYQTKQKTAVVNVDVDMTYLGGRFQDNTACQILRDFMKDMYKGDLIVLGDPSVKPHDLFYIEDSGNKMNGIAGVKQVVSHMSFETGYVTNICPDAIVVVDDDLYQSYIAWICSVAASSFAMVIGYVGLVATWNKLKGTGFPGKVAGKAAEVGNFTVNRIKNYAGLTSPYADIAEDISKYGIDIKQVKTLEDFAKELEGSNRTANIGKTVTQLTTKLKELKHIEDAADASIWAIRGVKAAKAIGGLIKLVTAGTLIGLVADVALTIICHSALEAYARYTKGMQAVIIYPLMSYGVPLTAGINGHQGCVAGDDPSRIDKLFMGQGEGFANVVTSVLNTLSGDEKSFSTKNPYE